MTTRYMLFRLDKQKLMLWLHHGGMSYSVLTTRTASRTGRVANGRGLLVRTLIIVLMVEGNLKTDWDVDPQPLYDDVFEWDS